MAMSNGKIEEIGPAEDIYNHPQREYTRKLIAATPPRRLGGYPAAACSLGDHKD